ncbi:MAG: hypothetical protein QOF51_540, partial [Chloroflexota bacterium]|nr:hypothetical protein [Chloroflexota bacterium]
MAASVDIHRAALLLLDLQRDALHPEGAAARHGLAGIAPDDAAPLVG